MPRSPPDRAERLGGCVGDADHTVMVCEVGVTAGRGHSTPKTVSLAWLGCQTGWPASPQLKGRAPPPRSCPPSPSSGIVRGK